MVYLTTFTIYLKNQPNVGKYYGSYGLVSKYFDQKTLKQRFIKVEQLS